MKTVITVMDGIVTVDVDDGRSEPQSIGVKPDLIEANTDKPHIVESLHITPKPVAASTPKKPLVVKKPGAIEKAAASQRNCMICNDDISKLNPKAKICSKRDCKLERDRRHARASYYKRNPRSALINSKKNLFNEPIEEKPEKDVSWCKHCAAYTTHDSVGHPKPIAVAESKSEVKQDFMPGHEKTKEEIESWRPRPMNIPPEGGVTYGIPKGAEGVAFDDLWDCQMCRHYQKSCEFHVRMERGGKTPPKSTGKVPVPRAG